MALHVESTIYDASKAGTSLLTLPRECIGVITSFLLSKDLIALVLIGSRPLKAKIEQGCTQICVEIWPLSKWPLLAFQFRNLRSLRVIPHNKNLYHPIVAMDDCLLPPVSHQALERLEVRSLLSFTLLRDDRLGKLLPSLKSLKLYGEGAISIEDFAHVPPTVTEFVIKIHRLVKYGASSMHPISDLSVLSKEIESLSIVGFFFVADDAAQVQEALPPNLTRLRIATHTAEEVIQGLPHTIRHLSLYHTDNTKNIVRFSVTHLPLVLLRYVAMNYHPVLRMDSPFPGTLKTLDLTRTVVIQRLDGTPLDFDVLPLSLTSLTGFSVPLKTSIDYSALLPHIKELCFDWSYVQVPPTIIFPIHSLQSLVLNDIYVGAYSDAILSSIPDTLTHLYVPLRNTPQWLKTIAQRLSNLKHLELHPTTDVLPYDAFWRHMYGRLEQLRVTSKAFERIADLGGDWKCLKTLFLTVQKEGPDPYAMVWSPIKPEDALPKEVDNIPWRYPVTLEKMNLHVGSQWSTFWPRIPHMTNLKSLRVQVMHSVVIPKDLDDIPMEIFQELPSSLRTLDIEIFAPFEPKHLAELPSGLTSLTIELAGLTREKGAKGFAGLSNPHFESLPRSLTELNVADRDCVPLNTLPDIPLLAHTTIKKLNTSRKYKAIKEATRQKEE